MKLIRYDDIKFAISNVIISETISLVVLALVAVLKPFHNKIANKSKHSIPKTEVIIKNRYSEVENLIF